MYAYATVNRYCDVLCPGSKGTPLMYFVKPNPNFTATNNRIIHPNLPNRKQFFDKTRVKKD